MGAFEKIVVIFTAMFILLIAAAFGPYAFVGGLLLCGFAVYGAFV